jgi:hypothetical protein
MKNEQGLNGFWGWIKRNVHKISGICTMLGHPEIGIALEAAVGISNSVSTDNGGGNGGMGDNTMGKSSDYEPTISETAILDKWADNELMPFFQKLLLQINEAFSSSDPNYQLQQINDVLMKICVVKSYYTNHVTTGLSLPAVNLRSELIDTVFQPIEDLIANSILNESSMQLQSYSVTVNNINLFSPMKISAITINCDKYVVNNGVLQNSQGQSLLTTNPVVVNPVTNQVITNNTNNANQSINPNEKGYAKTFAFVMFGLAVVIALMPSKKSQKKVNSVQD